MCGICGIVPADPSAAVDRALLARMTGLLAHRGPDGEGFHTAPGIGLGMRRLSIVDLAETGDQPIGNEDGSVVVVCNGEIYNAPELQRELEAGGHEFRGHSDVEVIVHLYEEMGARCLSRLRGMFALALWDARRRRLLLARDRMGIKPLYYGIGADGSLFFASEAKSILAGGAVDRTLDPAGLSGLLYFGGAVFDRSLWKGIRQVRPGERLVFEDGEARRELWWDLDFGEARAGDLPRGEGEWAEAILAKLRESVRIHLRGDVPVAGWLSPGIDSSTVAWLAAEEQGGLPTFSLGFEDARYDELRDQKTLDLFPGFRLSGERILFGDTFLDRLREGVWHREQPAVLHFSYHVLGAAMRGRYKVALTGQGSDEIFGGYPWYRRERRWQALYGLPAPVRRFLARRLPRISPPDRRAIGTATELTPRRFAALQWSGWPGLRPLLLPELRTAIEAAYEGDDGWMPPEGFGSWDRFQQLLYIEHKTRMPSFINLGLDAGSMAESIEPRLPFLDHELVELCTRIPPRLRARTREKHMLRKAVEPYLPAEITWRRKKGIRTPDPVWQAEWGDPPDFVHELLSEERVRACGYFDPRAVRELRNASEGLGPILAAVVGMHMWHALFVEGGP